MIFQKIFNGLKCLLSWVLSMLKKLLLCVGGTPTYTISIGTQTNCSVQVDKQEAKEGETVTVTLAWATGFGNVNVFTNPAVTVTKVNDTTYTFLMPGQDVVVGATADKLTFAINLNAGAGGTASLSTTRASYGDRVTITCSPSSGYKVASVSGVGGIQGSGNSYWFTMPANDVTVSVAFVEDLPTFVINVGVTDVFGAVYGFDSGSLLVPFGSMSPDNIKGSKIASFQSATMSNYTSFNILNPSVPYQSIVIRRKDNGKAITLTRDKSDSSMVTFGNRSMFWTSADTGKSITFTAQCL